MQEVIQTIEAIKVKIEFMTKKSENSDKLERKSNEETIRFY